MNTTQNTKISQIKEDTLIVEPISIAELPIVKYDESDPRNNRYSILIYLVSVSIIA